MCGGRPRCRRRRPVDLRGHRTNRPGRVMTSDAGPVRVAVIGCGAIGSLYAAHLARVPGVEVWAVDRWAEHVDAIKSQGLRVTTALGLYEAFLDGRRVGDVELAPGYTQYRARVQYQAYDVSSLVRPGRHVLAVLLADGWYRGQVGGRGPGGRGARAARGAVAPVPRRRGGRARRLAAGVR